MNIEEEFDRFLYEWVRRDFGQSEADDPSWSIKELAHDLVDEYWKIHDRQELENIKDDVELVAKNNGIELTEKQAYAVADKYRFSEAYCEMSEDDILYYIEHYKGE